MRRLKLWLRLSNGSLRRDVILLANAERKTSTVQGLVALEFPLPVRTGRAGLEAVKSRSNEQVLFNPTSARGSAQPLSPSFPLAAGLPTAPSPSRFATTLSCKREKDAPHLAASCSMSSPALDAARALMRT